MRQEPTRRYLAGISIGHGSMVPAAASTAGRLRAVSHPALGLPTTDMTAGFPAGADRIRASRGRLAARALEVAVDGDPTLRERHGDTGLRHLLRDLDGYLERMARAVASGSPAQVREWAEWVAPVFRRRRVPMDDLIALSEGLRVALAAVLTSEERVVADAALDEGIAVFHWHRGLAGDARKRNRYLFALYKGG